jgi:hypothetical protein
MSANDHQKLPNETPKDPKNYLTLVSRRGLLKALGRTVALVVLVGGVGAVAARTSCRKTKCAGCSVLAECELPNAEESRVAAKHGGRS